MTMKKVTLRVFKISQSGLFGDNENKLGRQLINKLKQSQSVNDRRITLNSASTQKEDLIAAFKISPTIQNCVYCLMLRVSIGNNVKPLTKSLFDKKEFGVSELIDTKSNGAEATYEDHFYFAVNDDYLITNLPGNKTINNLQTYFYSYLAASYELTPVIDENLVTKLGDVSKIVFKDEHMVSGDNDESVSSVAKIAKNLIKNLLVDTTSLQETELDQMITATLNIKVSKPKASAQNTLGAVLKPIADLDNVEIVTKSNKKIVKGSEVLLTKTVNIELIDGKVLINEPQLYQEMDRVFKDLNYES